MQGAFRSLERYGLQRPHNLIGFPSGRNGRLGPRIEWGEGLRPVADQAVCLLFAVVGGKQNAEFPVLLKTAALENEGVGHHVVRLTARTHHPPTALEVGTLCANRWLNDLDQESFEVLGTLRAHRIEA